MELLFSAGGPGPAVGGGPLSDEDLLALYAFGADRPALRANVVTSLDGSATVDGLSGGLGGPADTRVFGLLRRLCDVVLVGAGTVRAEGYAGDLVDAEARRWRSAHGLAERPALAIVSPGLGLPADGELFRSAPVRPLVLTVRSAPRRRRAALDNVAEVVDCGEDDLDPTLVREALAARGLARVQCEGGPTLLGALLAADAVDEFCVTIDAVLTGGSGSRVARAPVDGPARAMRALCLLREGDVLLGRYARDRRGD